MYQKNAAFYYLEGVDFGGGGSGILMVVAAWALGLRGGEGDASASSHLLLDTMRAEVACCFSWPSRIFTRLGSTVC